MSILFPAGYEISCPPDSAYLSSNFWTSTVINFRDTEQKVGMPVENMEEEGLARIPDLNIAQWIFTCKTNPV